MELDFTQAKSSYLQVDYYLEKHKVSCILSTTSEKFHAYHSCCDCRILFGQPWDHTDGMHSGLNSLKCT